MQIKYTHVWIFFFFFFFFIHSYTKYIGHLCSNNGTVGSEIAYVTVWSILIQKYLTYLAHVQSRRRDRYFPYKKFTFINSLNAYIHVHIVHCMVNTFNTLPGERYNASRKRFLELPLSEDYPPHFHV